MQDDDRCLRDDLPPAWFFAARDRLREHLEESGETAGRGMPSIDLPPASPAEPPAPGEVRTLFVAGAGAAEAGPVRLVLVRYVVAEDGYASVALLSEHTRMAGGTDVLLSADRTGLGHVVMVETDVVAPVWLGQLGGSLGRVDRHTLVGILETEFTGQLTVVGAARGMPLAGPSDRRWAFKLVEAEQLRELSASCAEALGQGDYADDDPLAEDEDAREWSDEDDGEVESGDDLGVSRP